MKWTWRDLALALTDLLETLGPSDSDGELLAQATAAAFSKAEERLRPAIDRAIRTYATTAAWPRLSSDERRFLELRINYALSILAALAQGSPIPPATPQTRPQDAVRWLLIDAWAKGGTLCTQRQLTLLAGWRWPSDQSI